MITRRQFCGAVPVIALAAGAARPNAFAMRYVTASAMYGTAELGEIVAQVPHTGADYIDIWPRPHGNQREQLEELGAARFAQMLRRHEVKLGVLTQYRLGPFGLQPEMKLARKLGGPGTVLVTGGRGPKNLEGQELKAAVKKFVEQMKPHIEAAEQTQTVIAVENHANSLINTPDSCRWLVEMADSPHLGIAVAPHHLPQDAELIAGFIESLGEKVAFFYAQQHGMGSSKKLPKEQELLQMPGRGPLDFLPLVRALKKTNYQGLTEIFMHPVPRGVPILETPQKITAEINRSRKYLNECVAKS